MASIPLCLFHEKHDNFVSLLSDHSCIITSYTLICVAGRVVVPPHSDAAFVSIH